MSLMPARNHRLSLAAQAGSRLLLVILMAAAANLFIAWVAIEGPGRQAALAVALLPAILLGGAWLLTRPSALVLFALVLVVAPEQISQETQFAGKRVSTADLVALLAIASWVAPRLIQRDRPTDSSSSSSWRLWPSSPTLGTPLLIFAPLLAIATVRGHYEYGASILGQPLRLALFAAVAGAIGGLDARTMHRWITIVVYSGVVWQLLNGVYYVATGTSQTSASSLSTGGTRYLAGSTAGWLAVALFLAILNLQADRATGRRFLHMTIALLACVGIVLGFNRTTFVVVVLFLPLLIASRKTLNAAMSVLPLIAPIAVLAAVLFMQLIPNALPTLVHRISLHPSRDQSIVWRKEASSAVWAQVRESTVVGVGFGRRSTIVLPATGAEVVIGQDAHEDYLWLLAGGGVLLLGAYLLLIGSYLYDVVRKLKRAVHPHERVLLMWSLAGVGQFLIGGLTSPVLSQTPQLLMLWTLLLLPSIVPERPLREEHPSR